MKEINYLLIRKHEFFDLINSFDGLKCKSVKASSFDSPYHSIKIRIKDASNSKDKIFSIYITLISSENYYGFIVKFLFKKKDFFNQTYFELKEVENIPIDQSLQKSMIGILDEINLRLHKF